MASTAALPPDDLPLRTADGWKHRRALLIAIGIFSALSIYCAVKSQGFLEADAMTHYMFSRHSFAEWPYFVNVWGRPLCTAAYAIPANLFSDVRSSVIAVRITSLILAILCGLVTYRVAKDQGFKRPELAAILLFAQPLFFCHSWSELTEIPFALLAILAFRAYQTKRYFWMTVLISITPAGRPEGAGLMVMAALGLLLHARWYYLFLMPVPLLIWGFFGAFSWSGWASILWWPYQDAWWSWVPRNLPYSAKSAYGNGPWYHFLVRLPILLSPMMFPFFFLGVSDMVRRILIKARLAQFAPGVPSQVNVTYARADTVPIPEQPRAPFNLTLFTDHRIRCELVILSIPLSIFFVHSFLWWQGLMASNGELRYLLCVAPFWALIVARGWEWVWDRFKLPAPLIIAGLFALAPMVANRFWKVVPLPMYENDVMGKCAADWYREHPTLSKAYPKVMATPPSLYFFMDLSQSNTARAETWGPENVKKLPAGTILFWDPIFGTSNADATRVINQQTVEKAGWVWIGNVVYGGSWCNVYLSPMDINGQRVVDAENKLIDPGKYVAPGRVSE